MALMTKAILESDLPDRHVAPPQLHCRTLHAAPNQILMRWHSKRFAKHRFKVRNTQSGGVGDLAESQIASEVVFDEAQDALQFASGHRRFSAASRTGERTVIPHDARGKSGGQRVRIDAARWITAFHLRFQSPTDVFDLLVPGLKAI